MVLPLIVAGGLGIAGTLLGSWLGSSKKEASQETQQQVTAQQPAEVTIHPYSFYAPSQTYAPDYQYQPTVIIGSPGAKATSTATTKKEITSTPTVTPQVAVIPQVTPAITPKIEQPTETSAMSDLMPLVLVGGGIGLLYLLIK